MNSNEGLEAGEILDELDVEVPTAAYMAYNNAGGAGLVPYLTEGKAQRNTNVVTDEKYEYPLKLVTREKMKEALVEAVQQERRRILQRIRFLSYFEFEEKSKEFNQGYRKVLEELEEELEVESDAAE